MWVNGNSDHGKRHHSKAWAIVTVALHCIFITPRRYCCNAVVQKCVFATKSTGATHCADRREIWHGAADQWPQIQVGPPSGEKMTSCRFSRWRISAILDFWGPMMGSLKTRCTTSYRSSIDTLALNCHQHTVTEKPASIASHSYSQSSADCDGVVQVLL